MQENNLKKTIKQPWQGMTLLIIRSVMLVTSVLAIFYGTFSGATGKHTGVIFVVCFIIFLANAFLVVDIFMKKKIFFIFSILVSLISAFFNILIIISAYITLYTLVNEIEVPSSDFNHALLYFLARLIIIFSFNGFLIYLAFKSLKHPFYNQKKVK